MTDSRKPKKKILLQLDSDQHPSVFDSVVAIDSGVDHLLSFGNVEPLDVRDLVHGTIFTRGGSDLARSAIFVGGSSVQAGERLLRSVEDSFFGPFRVSTMLDANGANTTAVAAVLILEKHVAVNGARIAVLAATGSVGRRVCWLVARLGADVTVISRSLERATAVCQELQARDSTVKVTAAEGISGNLAGTDTLLADQAGIIAAGAAGAELVPPGHLDSLPGLQCAIDLNAVPPAGLGDIQPDDNNRSLGNVVVYGALGVGGLKMKIHKRCLGVLFESNDKTLDIDEIYSVGRELVNSP